MISQTAEYALRAIVCLAGQRDSALTTQQIATATKVPAGYLSKVLQALGKSGLVGSQRGLHGGFTLVRPADELTVLEVVNAVDPVKRIDKCPLNLKAHHGQLCPLHQRLDEAIGLVERAFGESTIAELLAEPTSCRPLDMSLCGCGGPVVQPE